MRFLSRYARLKERLTALERYVSELGREHQKCLDGLHAGIRRLEVTLRAEVEARARETNAFKEQNNKFKEFILARAMQPEPSLEAISALPSPSVAIVVPTFNRAGILPDAIKSVQAQIFGDWELVIVDDGSSDDTGDAVRPFLEDSRIRYIRQKQAGSAAARNAGILATSAPLLAYLDSDNLWFPEFLQQAVSALATMPDVDLVYGAMVLRVPDDPLSHLVWRPFSREKLLNRGFIDTNVLVHRRTLVEKFGGWSTDVQRMQDWDLVLRFTQEKPAFRLPVLAVHYRICDDLRVSSRFPLGPSMLAIQRRMFPPKSLIQRPRVLCVLSDEECTTNVEAGIRCMMRWGVHVEIWRPDGPMLPSDLPVPVHYGQLAQAVASCRPDVIHVHGLRFAMANHAELANSRKPLTVCLEGSEQMETSQLAFFDQDFVAAIHAFPNQARRFGVIHEKLKSSSVAFDSTIYLPDQKKDPRLVVCMANGVSQDGISLFLKIAGLLREFRFVLGITTCDETILHELMDLKGSLGSPAEIQSGMSREDVGALVGVCSISIHPVCPPDYPVGDPLGQPASIFESMATGGLCFVPSVADLVDFMGNAGVPYSSLEDLASKIRETLFWSETTWRIARLKASDHAYRYHPDVVVFRDLFMEWAGRAGHSEAGRGSFWQADVEDEHGV